jgi:hypothetical protein
MAKALLRKSPTRKRATKGERMVQRILELDESIDQLCDVLLRYRNSNVELAELIASGGSAREAIGNPRVPQRRRRELTVTLDAFEAARHQYRLALFALCMEEGASITEVGRALGISRQRASVLVKAANRKRGRARGN